MLQHIVTHLVIVNIPLVFAHPYFNYQFTDERPHTSVQIKDIEDCIKSEFDILNWDRDWYSIVEVLLYNTIGI